MNGRFDSAAAHYLAGRPPYPARLIARVAQLSGLGADDEVLDLGCGPAPLARAFAPRCRHVLALDPEPAMLTAARAAGLPGNVTLAAGGSQTIGPGIGPFRLVAVGRAFHWMDRAETLRRLDGITTADATLAFLDDDHPRLPDNAWQAEWAALLAPYNESDPARAARRGADWPRHEAILLDSAFCELEEITVLERRAIGVETLVDRALSMSSTAATRIGAQAERLVADIRAWFAGAAPGGTLAEAVATSALLARRPRLG